MEVRALINLSKDLDNLIDKMEVISSSHKAWPDAMVILSKEGLIDKMEVMTQNIDRWTAQSTKDEVTTLRRTVTRGTTAIEGFLRDNPRFPFPRK
jgi:hypothetical protein